MDRRERREGEERRGKGWGERGVEEGIGGGEREVGGTDSKGVGKNRAHFQDLP